MRENVSASFFCLLKNTKKLHKAVGKYYNR